MICISLTPVISPGTVIFTHSRDAAPRIPVPVDTSVPIQDPMPDAGKRRIGFCACARIIVAKKEILRRNEGLIIL